MQLRPGRHAAGRGWKRSVGESDQLGEFAMLYDVSEFIRECLMRAAEYRFRRQTPNDPQTEQHFHEMEVRWLDLAMSCELASRLTRSMCVAG